MPDPINPRFLRIYRVPKQQIEEGEIISSEPVPHTQAALNRTEMATGLVADSTWTTNGLPSRENANQRVTTTSWSVSKIILASVSLNAHVSSLIGVSARLTTHVDRSSYVAKAIDRLLRLHDKSRPRSYATPRDSSISPRTADEGDGDQLNNTRPGGNSPDDQPMDMEEDPATADDMNPHHKNPTPDTTQWQHVRSSKHRSPEAPSDSHATDDYD
jgi:hypothetical protein